MSSKPAIESNIAEILRKPSFKRERADDSKNIDNWLGQRLEDSISKL